MGYSSSRVKFEVADTLQALVPPSDGGTWVLCDGRTVSGATYPALNAKLNLAGGNYVIPTIPAAAGIQYWFKVA